MQALYAHKLDICKRVTAVLLLREATASHWLGSEAKQVPGGSHLSARERGKACNTSPRPPVLE
eukprot:1159761-Pelagomonas_calceolata.AAC.2